MITLGVVVDVPEPHAEIIRAARRSWRDPDADLIPPHITVVTPVSIDCNVLPAVESHLAAACAGAPSFAVHLRGTGTFRPVSPVVFLTVAQGITGCETIERRVRCGPLAVDLRFPYHPHVTVAAELPPRTLDRASVDLDDFSARFDVEEIALYELVTGGWLRRNSFPLGTSALSQGMQS